MRAALALLIPALFLAGCTATGDSDPFAYARKPLYTGGFEIAEIGEDGDSQTFRVTDGSIASVRMLVWVNASAGGATVTIADPAGSTMMTTSETAERSVPLNLGVWTVDLQARPESVGLVHILVVRG
jgi:hypothetical protein